RRRPGPRPPPGARTRLGVAPPPILASAAVPRIDLAPVGRGARPAQGIRGALTTATSTSTSSSRRTLAYVLGNFAVHARRRGDSSADAEVDPYCSVSVEVRLGPKATAGTRR